jgi:hypothetical protein
LSFVYTYLLSKEWGSALSVKLFFPWILYSLLFLNEISLLDALINSCLGGYMSGYGNNYDVMIYGFGIYLEFTSYCLIRSTNYWNPFNLIMFNLG